MAAKRTTPRAKPKTTGGTSRRAVKAGGRMKPPTNGVKVRMYRAGLGDCFLLCFPRKKTAKGGKRDAFTMLIDCGVFRATEGGGDRMRAIAESIREATRVSDSPTAESVIDLLVVTHEHWDHLSGFASEQARSIFEQIEVGKIWMAWTENPADATARRLQSGLDSMRMALFGALGMARERGISFAAEGTVARVLAFFGLAPEELESAPKARAAQFAIEISRKTREVRDWLRDEYGGHASGASKVAFLRPCDGGKVEPLASDVDSRVYVLGPPEDVTLLTYSDPRAADETDEVVYEKLRLMPLAELAGASFCAAFGMVGLGPGDAGNAAIDDAEELRLASVPFEGRHRVAREEVEAIARGEAVLKSTPEISKARQEAARRCALSYYSASVGWRRIDGDWMEAAGTLALQLDNATNNTSLAIAIEVGEPGRGPVLLFPADAQVGSWKSWFGKVRLRGRDGRTIELGKEMTWKVGGQEVSMVDLIRRTKLFKVGHHGSHNGTLNRYGAAGDEAKPLVEQMADGLVAMLPVDEDVAKKKAGYGEMPLTSIVDELLEATGGRVLRNDDLGEKPAAVNDPSDTLRGPLSAEYDRKFVSAAATELFFEHVIPASRKAKPKAKPRGR